jgi:WD40 repeat protein
MTFARQVSRLAWGVGVFAIGLAGLFVLVRFLKSHSDIVHDIAFSPDGKSVVSAGDDGRMIVWDSTWGWGRELPDRTVAVFGVDFSPDGRSLAAETWNGSTSIIQIRDSKSWNILWSLKIGSYQAGVLRYSPDGATLAFQMSNGISLLDVASRKVRATIRHVDVRSLAFSPDGKSFAGGCGDGTVRIWETLSARETRILQGHKGWVLSVDFSPDGLNLASCATDILGSYNAKGEARIWNVATAEVTAQFAGSSSVDAVAFSPRGKTLAIGQGIGTVTLADVSEIQTIETRMGIRGGVTSLAFSPDGTVLAAGGASGQVRLLRNLP